MATIASQTFLRQLKSIFPSPTLTTPDAVIAQPWYLVAAVAFSASRKPEAVPVVYEFALNELRLVQTAEPPERAHEQQMRLTSKVREAILQSGLLSGFPRVIESLIALQKVTPENLRSTQVLRNSTQTVEQYAKDGEKLFRSMYRETADPVQSLLDSAYLDLGWWCNTVGYGITYGGTDVLTQVETTYAIVAALIAVDAPRQVGWHLANAQHGGATREEAKAVREIAMKVAEQAGVKWQDGVPDVE
ncbi:uncharacterized protein LAESUDRAFT_657584 [Laetiporus sulphureus 93-53]|uniref:Carboxymuconolactone decarboxylase-like domain-containing protein n=1 Tax=Laetiporus sulphureus 93-53 TaxID=1314785 RepID=A0A165DCQ4_9APHY|nr:uncharacterized protein LAESUDRAFT_657584 [Laetiporus sulphureus 93-53]KZT04570.1 hypothetical protein LAESUDRAFT_657584 [Laetiporus sulphureus 93-53]